jgi:hypothetical protein
MIPRAEFREPLLLSVLTVSNFERMGGSNPHNQL